MKDLITAGDVKKAADGKENTIHVKPGTIITPAAQDAAEEFNIAIQEEVEELSQPEGESLYASDDGNVTPDLIARIVKEVMAQLSGLEQSEMKKEFHASGLCLVKGNTVECEKNTASSVGIKEVFTGDESANMKAGFKELRDSYTSMTLNHAEVNYIIEGSLDVTVKGATYRGVAGDVFYFPRGAKLTFSAQDKVKLFFVSYSA